MLPYPWDFPGKNTGVGCHFFLQGIFPAQGLNPCLLHQQEVSFPLSHQGGPFSYLTPLCKLDNFHTDTFNPLELLCFSCQMGVAFLPQNFFKHNFILKACKEEYKEFQYSLNPGFYCFTIFICLWSLSLHTHRHTQRHTHTHILSF